MSLSLEKNKLDALHLIKLIIFLFRTNSVNKKNMRNAFSRKSSTQQNVFFFSFEQVRSNMRVV